jgi:hypothetical protein
MNATYPARAAYAARRGATYFTQDSQTLTNSVIAVRSNTGRYTSEIPAMSYRKANSRARYANALYAAAIAALLTACSQTNLDTEAPKETTTTIHLSENSTADMPEIVVTGVRERPKAAG